jgi:hypothetical protein
LTELDYKNLLKDIALSLENTVIPTVKQEVWVSGKPLSVTLLENIVFNIEQETKS